VRAGRAATDPSGRGGGRRKGEAAGGKQRAECTGSGGCESWGADRACSSCRAVRDNFGTPAPDDPTSVR